MQSHETNESVRVKTNCHVLFYSVDRIRDRIPEWDSLSNKKKSRRLHEIEPESVESVHNITTETLTNYHADDLNPEINEPDIDAEYLALGDDDTDPERDNTELNNEIDRLQYTDAIDRDEEVAIVVFLSSDMLNGEHILEGGLVTEDDPSNADDKLLNHAIWSDPEGRLDPKTDQVVANLIVEISYGDAGDT